MSGNGWVVQAPCAGDFRFTSEEAEAGAPTEPLLLALLDDCRGCPFRSQCVDLVMPSASQFDGVCGGRLWRDGQVLATCEDARPAELRERRRHRITHGTEGGARAHNRRGERACSLCREAGRLAQQARRARKRDSGS